MKKRVLVLTSVGLSLLISSCTYDKDPFLDFKNEAKSYYLKYYENNPDAKKEPLFYFDIGTLRSALVRDENTVSFLGQFKLTDFTFSENRGTNHYFADIGNLPLSVNDTNNDGMPDSFKVGDFVTTDANGTPSFDVSKFVNNLPLVLHEELSDGTIATYSTVTKEGTILDSSNAKAYNPDFFFISDLKLNVSGLEGFASDLLDFTGKDVCILRKDLYQVIDQLTATAIPEQFNNVFNIADIFNGLYKRAKGLKTNDEMPQTLTIPGKHYTSFDETSAREVVVGPFSLINDIIGKVINSTAGTTESKTSLIHEIPEITIGEGVKTISLFAFNGSRTSDTEASNSKIKSIYLPSTLQNVQFNAFSNLDLDKLYVDKTFVSDTDGNVKEDTFKIVDFGDVNISMGDGNMKLDLNVTGSFGHTNIKNIYFEGYDNLNIETFPYSSTINLATKDGINEALKIYSKDNGAVDTNKTENLNDAFKKYDTVNPYYQVIMTNTGTENDKKYLLSSGISSIETGKTLYLPAQQYSLSTKESRMVVTGKVAREATPEEATLTFKLDQDLVIRRGAKLIIGSNIGSTESVSGINFGSFASLDLNGHNLIVEDGGSVIADGFIYDSNTQNKGKIIAKNKSQITTNVTINDFKNLNEIINKAENGVAPFDSYSLNSLLVDCEIDKGASLIGNISYIDDNFFNKHQFELVSDSNQALFQLTSGKLVVNKSKISSISVAEVILNNVELLTIRDNTTSETTDLHFGTANFPFAISNKTFSVDLDKVVNKTNVKVNENDSLVINDLVLESNSTFVAKTNNKLQVKNSITIPSTSDNVTLSGEYFVTNSVYDSIKNIVTKNDGKLNSQYSLIEMNDQNLDIPFVSTRYSLEAYVGTTKTTFEKKLIKMNRGYYYSYTSNGTTGTLNNSSDQVLANYNSSQSTWFRGNENTNISNKDFISSYSHADKLYILQEDANKVVVWNEKVAAPLANGTYLVDGKLYIKPMNSETLLEGEFVTGTPAKETIFRSSIGHKEFVYTETPLSQNEKTWIEIKGYDNYRTLQIVDSNALPIKRFIAFINNRYELGFDYDEVKHIVTKEENGLTKTYAYTNELAFEEFNSTALKWNDKQINDANDKLIYLNENSSWARVDELHKGLCKFKMPSGGFYYYFLINDKWYQSVEGQIAKTYNKLADMSFGVLKNKLSYNGSKYKFVMRNGDLDDTPFELFLPDELIKVTQKEFPDLWPTTAATDHLYAYRHIVKNDGSKYLFYKDDQTGKVELKKFEFAPGFVPSKPDLNNSNILTKFNFIIYKVIFDGETSVRTLYILTDASDMDNAVYAGNTNIGPNGELTDEYLAIAIFTKNNPISDLVGGNLPIPQK